MNKACGRLFVGLGLMIASSSATNGENWNKSAKVSEPRLKIDVREECGLGSRGDVVTGVRFSVT